ncbi:MAG: hypothetical protein J6J42_09015 [Lachnospiraceae bacterium]|nr:hypothetical protein [Lachnospiraceae bacterium]
MSWCPKCKNEYRAGIAICPDCNETLLEELTEELELNFVPLFQTTDEELKEKIIKYLIHCGRKIKEASGPAETENGEETVFTIFVPEKDAKEASMELRTVVNYDAKEKKGEEEEVKPRHRAPEPSTVYVDARSRYQEYKSSGIMFLVFAAAFLVFGILNVSGMINFTATTVSLLIVFGSAIAFLVAGISSLRKISSLKEEASTEELTTETILAYLKENFPKEVLLQMETEELCGELLYFQQMETMKEALQNKFSDKDEIYLDALLEDYYNSLEL